MPYLIKIPHVHDPTFHNGDDDLCTPLCPHRNNHTILALSLKTPVHRTNVRHQRMVADFLGWNYPVAYLNLRDRSAPGTPDPNQDAKEPYRVRHAVYTTRHEPEECQYLTLVSQQAPTKGSLTEAVKWWKEYERADPDARRACEVWRREHRLRGREQYFLLRARVWDFVRGRWGASWRRERERKIEDIMSNFRYEDRVSPCLQRTASLPLDPVKKSRDDSLVGASRSADPSVSSADVSRARSFPIDSLEERLERLRIVRSDPELHGKASSVAMAGAIHEKRRVSE